LNLSTKPKSKGIWSPASLCEEEQQNKQQLRSKGSPERSDSSSPDSDSPNQHHHPLVYHHQAAMMLHQRNNPINNLFRPFDPFTSYVQQQQQQQQQRSNGLWRPNETSSSTATLVKPSPVSPPDSSVGRCHNQSGEESIACSFSSEEEMGNSGGHKEDDAHVMMTHTQHYCRGCDQSFATHHGLQMHVRQNHCAPSRADQSLAAIGGAGSSANGNNSGAFPCPRCPKVFELGSSLDQHLASHHAARSFQVLS